MASPHFTSPTNLFGASGQKAAKAATTAPTKTVKVRAHTRAIPIKPPADVNTATVRPGSASDAKRFKPNFPGEPIAGYVPKRPIFGSKPKPVFQTGPKGQIVFQPANPLSRADLGLRPYYTNSHTLKHYAGPTGSDKAQLNAAQVAIAHQQQLANYGTPGYIARSLIPGGLNQSDASLPAAAVRAANAASFVLPGGGVGEAAGLFGFGLKALRGLRATEDAAKAVPAAAHVTQAVAPHVSRGQDFVGSLPDLAREPGYVYHRASATSFNQISKTGLRPSKPAGDNPRGVYFANEPIQAQGLAQKRGGIYFRVKREDLPKLKEGAFGESRVPHSVPRQNVEYLGEDGKWHPVATSTDVVRGALPGAKVLRGKQEAGYSAERANRVAAARVHLENPNLTPEERVKLAKAELAGELPKINFQGFSELNNESLQALQTHILDHPHLLPFQKIRASDALVNALAGKVPTRSEIVLLEHIFGKDTANSLGAVAASPFRDRLLSALNVPRSLMASFDLSAPFRQGLMVATRHPTIFARNFGPMVKAFGGEKVYHAMLDEIRARPTYPLMIEAKLPITELGRDVGGREERFASDYAEKLTGGKYGPVRASGRAYTGFLDKTRADVFDHLIQRAEAQGINVQDQKFLQSLGKYVGSATGRGDLGAFQEAGKVLNTFFFSPRLLAARLNFLNPAYYARLDPFARKEALRSAIQLAGTLSVLLALASRIPGVKVATDPRNPDWGKIRFGNTRLDIAGGFQQELRLLAQLATGVAISSTTGKKLNLTARGFGDPTRLDIALRFFEGKESPLASLVTDWLRGSNQIGQKFTVKSEAVQRLTPLLGQDAYDLYRENHGGVNGLAAAFAGYGVGAFGLGLQTYGPPAPKPSGGSGGYFSGPTRSGGGYFSGTTSGGSPYFSSP